MVKSIFELYLNGKGFDSIARSLSKKGYPTPSQVAEKSNAGRYWHGSTIKTILSNPHYTGDLVQGINDKEYLNNLAAQALKKQKQATQMLNKIKDEINVSKAKKKRYLEMLAEKQITHEEYREVADEHKGRINELNIKRSGLEASLRHDEFLGRIENLRNTINRFLPLHEVTEEILHHFVERIEVNNNGIPTITYRFSILPD